MPVAAEFQRDAAMAAGPGAASTFGLASAGGMFPVGLSRRRLLNPSSHSSVAEATASKPRHGPRR